MPAITPAFMFDLESNMRQITVNEYQRLAQNLWWRQIATLVPSQSKKERVFWLLETAKIERTIRNGGQMIFEDIVSQTTEYENENAVAGLKLKKEKFEDLDGKGIDLATHWSRQIGAYSAYWPQKVVAQALLANPITYDGLAFFATTHPYNPYNTGAGVFANRFTGAASGVYPGALPIHGYGTGAVDVDAAITNLGRALGYIASLKMPNGEDPRFVRAKFLFHPPAMTARVTQMLSAKFINQGGSSGDIEAMVKNFGITAVELPELGANFGGSDTTWYLGLEEIVGNELGAFLYIEREPFSVVYHGPMTDAQLARIREFQWTTEGRNTVAPGHPYLLFRAEAT